MVPSDIVEKLLGALEEGNLSAAAPHLSDDFIITGLIPEAMNKNEFLGLMKGLVAAMPDFSFNVSDAREEGDRVRLLTHLRGTHTQPLNLSAIGIPPFPPTGVEVVLPEETMEFSVREGKVFAAQLVSGPGGGLRGLLRQLGAELSTRVGTA
ncbi:MAG: nuclear transport factor 2 family protein [Endomicrobiales bacterium]